MAFLQDSRVAAASLATLAAASIAHGQVIESPWVTAPSGSWTDAARWSTPEFPTARGPDEYRAIIDVLGGPYTISLGSDIDLSELVYTSSDATIDGGGVGTIVVRDDLEFGATTVRAIAELMSEGTLRFTGDTVCEIDDTPLCLPGLASARKLGAGDILLSGTGLIEISSGATFTIENSGDIIGDPTARLINAGTFTKDSPGLTLIEDLAFENTGTVVVRQGTLEITDPVLPSIGVLGPATYEIDPGAAVSFSGTTLDTNQADVIFNGPGASFSELSGVTLNQGLVLAAGGAAFVFSDNSTFTNEGDLAALGSGSVISTIGAISNNNSALTVDGGGVISAGGTGVTNNGLAQGVGTIVGETFLNIGVVSPGNSPGTLVTESATGANHVFEQTGAGVLMIEIEGRTPGVTHDVLEVRGVAIFDGTLQLDFAPFSGEPPIQAGDQFQIILADNIDGVFNNIDISGLGTEGAVDVFLNPTGVVVVVTQVPAPGAIAVLGLGGLAALRRRR